MKFITTAVLVFMTLLYGNTTNVSEKLYLEAKGVFECYSGQAGELDKVRHILDKLMMEDKKSAETLIIMGRLILYEGYINRNNYRVDAINKAIDLSKYVIKEYPKNIDGYILYSSAFRNSSTRRKGLEESRKILDKAALIDKNNIRLKLSYLSLADREKDNDRVIGIANQVLFEDISDCQKSSILGYLATTYRRTKEYKKSGDAYLEIIKLEPKSPWAYMNYSSFLRTQKEYDKAIEYAKKSLSLADTGMGRRALAKAYYGKGYQVHWKQKDRINSKKWFQLSVDIDSRLSDSHYGLGESYYYSGYASKNKSEIERAKSEYELCLSIKPDHKQARKKLNVVNKLLSRL